MINQKRIWNLKYLARTERKGGIKVWENLMDVRPFTSQFHDPHERLPHVYGVREKQSCSFEWSVYGQPWNLRMITNFKNAFFPVLMYHLYIYLQLQHEARLSMEFLDNRFLDGFEVLFMKPVPFTQTFDQFLL